VDPSVPALGGERPLGQHRDIDVAVRPCPTLAYRTEGHGKEEGGVSADSASAKRISTLLGSIGFMA